MHILHLGHVLEDKVTLQGASVGRGWSRSRAWSCGRVASRPAVLGGATAFGSVRLEFVKLTQYSFLTPPPPWFLPPFLPSFLFTVHASPLHLSSPSSHVHPRSDLLSPKGRGMTPGATTIVHIAITGVAMGAEEDGEW